PPGAPPWRRVPVDRAGAPLACAFGGTREERPVARRRPSLAAERPPKAHANDTPALPTWCVSRPQRAFDDAAARARCCERRDTVKCAVAGDAFGASARVRPLGPTVATRVPSAAAPRSEANGGSTAVGQTQCSVDVVAGR